MSPRVMQGAGGPQGSEQQAEKLGRTGVTTFLLLLLKPLVKLLMDADSHLLPPEWFPLCSGTFRSPVALIKRSLRGQPE